MKLFLVLVLATVAICHPAAKKNSHALLDTFDPAPAYGAYPQAPAYKNKNVRAARQIKEGEVSGGFYPIVDEPVDVPVDEPAYKSKKFRAARQHVKILAGPVHEKKLLPDGRKKAPLSREPKSAAHHPY